MFEMLHGECRLGVVDLLMGIMVEHKLYEYQSSQNFGSWLGNRIIIKKIDLQLYS